MQKNKFVNPDLKHRASVLVYKVDSFDNDVLKNDVLKAYPDSIILVFNRKGIFTDFSPPKFGLKRPFLGFLGPRIHFLRPFLSPMALFIDHVRIFSFLLWLSILYRPRVFIIENTFVAALAGILRRIGLAGYMIYIPGDWLAGGQVRKGFSSRLFSNVAFPLFDYLACRLADLTLNCTQAISEARRKFWGRKIAPESLFQNRLEIKAKSWENNKLRQNIAFLGSIRPESGLEIALKALQMIRKEIDAKLKFIGVDETAFNNLKRQAAEWGVDGFLTREGFVERQQLAEVLKDCFCGINLITIPATYTSRTLPAKVIDYLQYLLPVIATSHIGEIAQVIRDKGIGLIIEPEPDSFINAVRDIYSHQDAYREKIRTYILDSAKTAKTIIDFIP